ncbi:hypothetical protein FDA94_07790 [Herbidospora galbida]|uniref:Uncharacterized protein n=1 Tax=Herbidospora galbida TaxID=2575442 RepID=A0A4U3MNL1_9ACTN|nr:hypothetical protein [Herbidospora galbida]TKK89787.1 hypothetical protein FDA94_07790 [Herbidospora galbida]
MTEQAETMGQVGRRPRFQSLRTLLNILVIIFSVFMIIVQTPGLLAGKPSDAFEVLFGWDTGSWSWVGRVAMIIGWLAIIYYRVQALRRTRAATQS